MSFGETGRVAELVTHDSKSRDRKVMKFDSLPRTKNKEVTRLYFWCVLEACETVQK